MPLSYLKLMQMFHLHLDLLLIGGSKRMLPPSPPLSLYPLWPKEKRDRANYWGKAACTIFDICLIDVCFISCTVIYFVLCVRHSNICPFLFPFFFCFYLGEVTTRNIQAKCSSNLIHLYQHNEQGLAHLNTLYYYFPCTFIMVMCMNFSPHRLMETVQKR